MLQVLLLNWDKISTIIFAALGTIFAGLSWYYAHLSYVRDNPKIEVTVSKMKRFNPNNPELVNHDVIMFRAVNIWRRPVTLNTVFISFSKTDHWIIPSTSDLIEQWTSQLPKTILECEEIVLIINYDLFLQECIDYKKYPVSINISSSINKNYRAKFICQSFPDFMQMTSWGKVKNIFQFKK